MAATEQRVFTGEEVKHLVVDFMQMKEFCKDPFVISRAEGVRYWDQRGKEYLDGLSGVFVVNVGHGNRRVIDAVTEQMKQLAFAPPLHATTPTAVKLAGLMASLTPGDLNTIKFAGGGSEANETALKLIRQYHRQSYNPLKYKVIAFYKGYHGSTHGALSATATTRRKYIFEPLVDGFLHTFLPHCYRCPYGKEYPGCGLTCADMVEEIIVNEAPESVAAVIIEPISNTAGTVVPPPEFLPRLREICDRHEVLLLFDEVITGFGRTGQMFAAQTFGVTPDLISMGKGMSSGYVPLAAVAFSDKVAQAFWGEPGDHVEFSHGFTYAGYPVACAAGLASVGEIMEKDLCGNARRMGEHVRARFEELKATGVVGDVRGKGLLNCLEFSRDPEKKLSFPEEERVGAQVAAECQRAGLILRPDVQLITLAPPLCITRAEVDNMVDIIEGAVKKVLGRRAGA